MKRTRKNQTSIKIKATINGELVEEKEGWKKVRIYGKPYERGFAHGVILCKELERVKQSLEFIVGENLKMKLSEYTQKCKTGILPIVKKEYPEIYQELRGISAGAKQMGVSVSVLFLIGWNSYLSFNPPTERCSAFIATGDATASGDIVMAHNTHTDFLTGQLLNIIMTVEPSDGHAFTMQTSPGYVASSSDWFLCSNGIIGCETTISKVNFEPDFKHGHPYFCRIRNVMQYAKTLDDCIAMMVEHNAGDYPCSWHFGDIKTNEIMLLELGLEIYSVERLFNGIFHGMNSAMDFKLRSLETNDTGHTDGSTSVGARNNRLNFLLNSKYYGKINLAVAKMIISDHYDEVAAEDKMTARTICKHSELDESTDFVLKGCTDGKVVDSKLAQNMHFYGRFGSCCGRIFDIKEHVKKHPKYEKCLPFIHNFERYKWTHL